MTRTSITIQLYKHKTLSDTSHPIYLIVTRYRKRVRISLGISCKPDNWNVEMSLYKSKAPKYKENNEIIMRAKTKAKSIIYHFEDIGKDYSVNDFKRKFNGVASGEVFPFFDTVIQRQFKNGKIGNSEVYKGAKKLLSSFTNNPKLRFNEINYSFLMKYEDFFRERNVLDSTISVYMRTLRALFRKAIEAEIANPELYPFHKYKISKLKSETTKRAITKEEIKRIEKYVSDPNTKEEDSKNIFLFSFYTQGMNFTDIVKLKWTNLERDRIIYKRSKTGKLFSIKILPPVQLILEYYKTYNSNNEFIFPILDNTLNGDKATIRNKTKNRLKRLNKHLKKIGKECKIEKPLTSYVARHSYATVMKRMGLSTSIISEALGHKDEKTTQIYLDSFENKTLDRANEALL